MYKKILSSSIHGAGKGISRLKKKLGASPGTVEYTGLHAAAETRIYVTDYDESTVERHTLTSRDPLPPRRLSRRWIQISGLSDTRFITEFGSRLAIPALVLEDIVNPGHAAKMENLGDFLFFIIKVPLFDEQSRELHFEHVALIVLENTVVSFQETDTFHFEPLIRRLEVSPSRIRRLGCDYFVYAMLDVVIDTYTYLADLFTGQVDDLEDEVLATPHKNHVSRIHILKQQISVTRKAVRPMRGIADALAAGDLPHITQDIRPFALDLKDHVYGMLDNIETQRENVVALMDSYLSLMSHRMNQVVKMLTIMSTIFIPLSFLAGLYGMNFEHMPELHFRYGYFVLLGAMATIAVLMLVLFKSKKWL